MSYRSIRTQDDLQTYLSGASIVAFDFETAPDEAYRSEDNAALDAHHSHIVGISFSVAEADAVYLPLAHRIGENASEQPAIWEWLSGFFADPTIIKVAHNLGFESMFLYARGIVLQEPCYDTIAAAQLIYKNEKEFRTLGDCGLKTLVPDFFGEQLSSYPARFSFVDFCCINDKISMVIGCKKERSFIWIVYPCGGAGRNGADAPAICHQIRGEV